MDTTNVPPDPTREAYDLFAQWLDLDTTARAALLERVRKQRPLAHARMIELIDADSAATRLKFMAGSAIADAGSASSLADADIDCSGQRIGNWELERSLGAGGMGQVWLARRCDGLHQGHAAIKMLRVVVADARANDRFAQEGQILARLVHPNIAMLLDAGFSADGQRYLVLEYVAGERIDRWCDEHRLDLPARLKLFLQVCAAVAYAHANLIVHRDLKPSNILVLADGTAKLLDFGIAKLIEADAGVAAQLTGEAGTVMTPGYAAPEQISGDAITTATDVYALGVILYGLLSGISPYGQNSLTPVQLARAVMETEPKRLSDAVGSVAAGDFAATRNTNSERLRRSLQGDLDVIAAKALKKNPAERYASVQGLAEDVRRHLDHLPISARADSTIYRARKFLRRHWVGAAAAAAITLAVAAGFAASIWQAHRAEHEASRAVAVKSFLVELFDATRNTNAGMQTRQRTVADLLESGADRLKTELGEQPDVRDEVYTMLVEIFDSSNEPERSLALARERVTAAETAFGKDDVRVAPALTMLGGVLLNHDQAPAAGPVLERSQALLDRAGDGDSLNRAVLWTWQGEYLFATHNPPPFAGNPLLQAVDLLRRRYADKDDFEVALGMYIALAGSTNHYAEAESAAAEMRQRAITRYGNDHVYVAQATMALTEVLLKEHKYEPALATAQEARAGLARFEGEHHPDVALAEGDVIYALIGLGRKDEARARFARFEAARPHDDSESKQTKKIFDDLPEKLR